jgi:hypothetical protein
MAAMIRRSSSPVLVHTVVVPANAGERAETLRPVVSSTPCSRIGGDLRRHEQVHVVVVRVLANLATAIEEHAQSRAAQ